MKDTVRILLLAVLAGSAAYWYFDDLKRERQKQKELVAAAEVVRQARVNDTSIDLLAPQAAAITDKGMIGLSATYQPSPPVWENAEKARYQALPPQAFDVLLVPFQVEGYALDRSTRSLMSTELVSAIRTSGARIPDVEPVLRALGESRRQFKTQEVHEIAYLLGVKRVIWAYAGHDRNDRMSVTFRSEDFTPDMRTSNRVMAKSDGFDNVAFSSESPPIVTYQILLPKIIEKLGYPAPAPPAKSIGRNDNSAWPSSPIRMIDDQPDAARDAFRFLMLAAMTPYSGERTRARFVEKAYLATLSLPEDHPDYRLLRARTFMLMGLRPAALHVIRPGVTPEEKALLGMLNGNFPQVATATPNVKPGIKQFLAELDLAVIGSVYGVRDKTAAAAAMKRLAAPGSVWPLFLFRALNDSDPWSQFDNLALKELLDAALPIQGFTAAGILGGASALADSSKLRESVDFSVHNHLKQIGAKYPAQWCCNPAVVHPSMQDYFELIEAIGYDNLARRITFLNDVQGQPQEALKVAAHLETVYKGFPDLSMLRALAENAAAAKTENEAREGLLRSAYTTAFDLLYQEQGQTDKAIAAFDLLAVLGRMDNGAFPNFYVTDVPFRSSYPASAAVLESGLKNATLALENATIDVRPLREISGILAETQHQYAEFDEVLRSVEGRFAGNTYVSLMQADNKVRLGKKDEAEKIYRQAIKSQPASWKPYEALSEILLSKGQAQESGAVVKAYPGFSRGSSENPVGIANNAYEVGSRYFWSGHFDLAKWFYRISANLNTGADSSLSSDARLKLLAGDYAETLAAIHVRATRYQAPNAYRDYLALLFAMGHSKEAWDGFNTLAPRISHPHLWDSPLVGHRIAGASEQDIVAWGKQDTLRHAGDETSYAANYALRAAIIDRVPSESIAPLLGELDRPAWKVADGYDHSVKPSADGQAHYVVGPDVPDHVTLPLGVFDQTKKSRIKSDLQYFAEAYRLLKTGNYDGARIIFEEASALYDLSQNSHGYMLAYFAFAAAKSGNTSVVDKKLAAFRPDQKNFDYLLARAAMSGIAGKPDDALPLLKRALYTQHSTEARIVFPEYEYTEILEWLYESTKNARYRELALEWARTSQTTQPWQAWPYAVYAKLSQDGQDRRRAIAMAYYLDRNSVRLNTIPKREIERAVKEFGPRNPFLNMRLKAVENPA